VTRYYTVFLEKVLPVWAEAIKYQLFILRILVKKGNLGAATEK
jgi:hypothetical protein